MGKKAAIVVNAASGRMGRMVSEIVSQSPDAELVGALERAGHPWIGQDLGLAMGRAALGVTVSDEPARVLQGADAVIDFSVPAASVALAPIAASLGVAHVIGTTGFSDAELAALARVAETGVIVQAGNMSLGVNLLVALTRRVAQALGQEFDIEIVEAHHRHKVDAPSGTALMLGEAAAQGRGITLAEAAVRARDGLTGPREPGSIGFAVVRGGDIVGEHDVIFAADGERIRLSHIATDRAIFARGALKAALWAQGRAAGRYDMLAVLGLDNL